MTDIIVKFTPPPLNVSGRVENVGLCSHTNREIRNFVQIPEFSLLCQRESVYRVNFNDTVKLAYFENQVLQAGIWHIHVTQAEL